MIKSLFFAVIAIYVVVNLGAYFFQRQLIYFPARERVLPGDIGLIGVAEVTLETASGHRLYCWFGQAQSGRPTVLFFHGNAGSVSHRADRFRELMREGYGVFMLGYPGYGGSDGQPSEASFRQASLIAYQYLTDTGLEPDDIVLYGESIGSAVAVQLAAGVRAKALVLEAPMASVVDIARQHYPYLLVNLLLKDRYSSIERIDQIDMPLLVMHGDKDAIVPISSGKTLFAQAEEPKTFIPFKGAGHNDLNLYRTVEITSTFVNAL